jgi:hypothetical protein
LKLAAESVRKVNNQRDSNGIFYARKAMIRCGLSLNINGQWQVEQLSPELQEICKTHENHFKGEPVTPLGKLVDVVEDVIDDGGDENRWLRYGRGRGIFI